MWHVLTFSRITVGLLRRRSDRPVIGGDLVGSHVPPVWGGSTLMCSQLTSGSTQPGEKVVIVHYGDTSSTRQYSIKGATEVRVCVIVMRYVTESLTPPVTVTWQVCGRDLCQLIVYSLRIYQCRFIFYHSHPTSSLRWLRITDRIEYKLPSLTYKVLAIYPTSISS